MIRLLAILGLVLRTAPAPQQVDPAAVCTVVEWVTPIVAVPSADWCLWPAVSSWPLFEGAWYTTDRVVQEFGVTLDVCHRSGGKVIAVPHEHGPVCAGATMFRPCLRASGTFWRFGDWIDPGTPSRGCGDVVLELLPRSDCERYPSCTSVQFMDGRLWFTRTEVDRQVW